jgi:DNA-binding PadR family transcriptional regulator
MATDETLPTLSRKEMVVLDLLLATGEMYGAQMVAGSGGRLGRGTVYVTLDRMEDKGYVESWEEEPRPGAIGLPRRLYRVTGLGKRVFQAWQLARAALAEATS